MAPSDHKRPHRGTTSDADAVIKLLLLGDGAVGKSSLLLRYCEDKFDPRHILTIGVDFKSKVINVGEERIRLQIWDTAGQERFRNITPVYFRSAMGVVLVFDVASMESFENVTYWLDSLENHASATLCKALVGNKIDIQKRQVSRRRGEALAAKHGTAYFETSALQNVGVEELFQAMATMIRKQQIEAMSNDIRDMRLAHFGRGAEDDSPAFCLGETDALEVSSGNDISCCGLKLRMGKKSSSALKLSSKSMAGSATDTPSGLPHGDAPLIGEDLRQRPSVLSANLEDPRSPTAADAARRERMNRFKSKVDVSRDTFTRRAPRGTEESSPTKGSRERDSTTDETPPHVETSPETDQLPSHQDGDDLAIAQQQE